MKQYGTSHRNSKIFVSLEFRLQKIALQPSKIFDPQGFEPIDLEVFICASSK
jgi:hypothetical protein